MDKYFALLKDLMHCRSVSENIPAVNKASAVMRAFLEAEGIHCTIEDCGGRNVIYASTVPGREADI